LVLPLAIGDFSLHDAIYNGFGSNSLDNIAATARYIEPLVSLLLYICSEAADYNNDATPSHAQPVKTKKGLRFFPPTVPQIWGVGERMGAALRRAESQNPGDTDTTPVEGKTSPRPHIRRAHWHSFWTGPRDGERKRVVKWLPPTGVSMDYAEPNDAPLVIRNLKK